MSARRLFALACLAVLAMTLTACETQAVRSFRAGRLYVSGTEALDRGEVGSAIEQLEAAVALVPAASEVHNHLGLAYWSAGNRERARAEFETAIELDCDNEAARTNLENLDLTESRMRDLDG